MKLFFQKKVFLHGEKENFEEYSLFLESAELTFAILINYLAEKNRTYPRATVSISRKCFMVNRFTEDGDLKG
jgi:hypothetical protein